MICPYCDHDNLQGLDNCEECLQDLSALDVPLPTEGLQRHLMEDTVGQISFDHLVIVDPTDSVAHAVSRIKAIGIGQAVVVDNERPVGILTERDFLYKVSGPEVDLRRILVGEWMTSEPNVVERGDSVRVLVNKMSLGGYRHVLIVRGVKLVGIISAKAIANYILTHSVLEFYLTGGETSTAARLREAKIRHLPLRPPALAEWSASIHETVEAMRRKHRGVALISDHGKLVGIFTERDLLNKIIGEPVSWEASVEQFMTKNLAKLSLDDSIMAVMHLMYDGGYRNVPLVDADGKAAWVVTVRDVITYFAEHFPKETLNLPPDPHQKMMRAEGA